MLNKPAVFGFALTLFTFAPDMIMAQTDAEIAQAQDEIWALEKAIYASRAEGNFQPYIDGASEHYMAPHARGGWEPGKEGLEAARERLSGNSQEILEMNFRAFTLHGETAVIYYHNHRTQLPDGSPADQWYEIMHIWARDGDGWTLVGSMPRLMADYTPPD